MLSIYFFYLICFPVFVLYKMAVFRKNEKDTLLTKQDTQFLRGMAAFFVILAHFIIWVGEKEKINFIIYFLFSQLGGIGVLVFFFVSGYGIYESYANKVPNWRFLWKRIKGVYLPYLSVKLILKMIGILFMDWHFSIKDLISVLLIEEWFIRVILFQYIIFFICWKLGKPKEIVLFSLIADCIMSGIFIWEGKSDGWINALWLFPIGMACSQYKAQISAFFKKYTVLKIILLFSLFILNGLFFAINKGTFWVNPMKAMAGCFLCLGICGILQCISPRSPVILHAGGVSLYLYVIHVNVWPILFMDNVIYKFWIVLIITVVCSELLSKLPVVFRKII